MSRIRTEPGVSADRPLRAPPDTLGGGRRTPNRWQIAIVGAAVAAAAVVVLVALRGDDRRETADIRGQGDPDTVFAADAARMERRSDGLTVRVEIPTPVPGSYEYPHPENIPPWADPHPRVSAGATGAPETFTLWMFVFNDPGRCTEGECNLDDLAPGALARGGSYQLDGRVAGDDRITLEGSARIGQAPLSGSPLDSPELAEVHVAIAPHGRALPGADGWRQLNGPVGDPTFWWAAEFLAP